MTIKYLQLLKDNPIKYSRNTAHGGDTFLFIYLDEGDNPNVFQAKPYSDDNNWITPLAPQTIQSIVNIGINRVKMGQNPY